MAWAFDIRNFLESDDSFILETRRRVSVKANEDVVAFARYGRDVKFLWTGTILSVDGLDGSATLKARVVVRRDERMVEPLQLDEYAYSLVKVYRFSNPARHFLQPYTRLSDFDLETLVRGQVFWARTAIGIFATALPRERLLEVQGLIARTLSGVKASNELTEVWRELRDFMEQQYLDIAPLFQDVANALRTMESVQDFSTEIGLVDDVGSRPDLLLNQSVLFAELSTAWTYDGETIATSLDRKISQQGDDQNRFEQEFRGRAWQILPIDDF